MRSTYDVPALLELCRALPPNDPPDVERHVRAYRGVYVGRRRRYYARRLAVWSKTGGRCTYCREPVDFGGFNAFHCDHVVPRADGGDDDLRNLVPSCEGCNKSKGARSLETWGRG